MRATEWVSAIVVIPLALVGLAFLAYVTWHIVRGFSGEIRSRAERKRKLDAMLNDLLKREGYLP